MEGLQLKAECRTAAWSCVLGESRGRLGSTLVSGTTPSAAALFPRGSERHTASLSGAAHSKQTREMSTGQSAAPALPGGHFSAQLEAP